MNEWWRRDHSGEVIGFLTIIRRDRIKLGMSGEVGCSWLCKCICGKKLVCSSKYLKSGKDHSCGCLKRIRRTGRTDHSSEYRTWLSMLQRCNNPKSPGYRNYGGRGITVCHRWKRYENFLSDMGRKPSRDHSIERKDVNAGYSPDNCCWATITEQARNRRNSRFIVFRGERKTLAEWEEITGINRGAINTRLLSGWTVEDALTKPVQERDRPSKATLGDVFQEYLVAHPELGLGTFPSAPLDRFQHDKDMRR